MRKPCLNKIAVMALAVGLTACNPPDVVPPTGNNSKTREPNIGKLFGDLEIRPFGDGKDNKAKDTPALAAKHNPYIWQASLEAVAFMTITTADPPSGVIVTDWYRDPATPHERFKFSILVSGGELSSESLRVRLFKQTQDKDGNWADSEGDKTAATTIAATIMSRAKVLSQK